jgi:hypothetical protein
MRASSGARSETDSPLRPENREVTTLSQTATIPGQPASQKSRILWPESCVIWRLGHFDRPASDAARAISRFLKRIF